MEKFKQLDEKTKKIIIGGAIGLVAIIIICCVAFGKESYRLVKVVGFEGDVELTREDTKQELYEDMSLIPEDVCKTKASSSIELLVDEDKHIQADEWTEFKINAQGNPKEGNVTIDLVEGTALFKIDNKLSEKDAFEVVTPNATMGVRGTQFKVIADYAITEVEVIEGVVNISTENDPEGIDVEAGRRAWVYEGKISVIASEEAHDELSSRLEQLDSLCSEDYELSLNLYDAYSRSDNEDMINEIEAICSEIDDIQDGIYDISRGCNDDYLSEEDANKLLENADKYLPKLQEYSDSLNIYLEEYIAKNGWRDAYKDKIKSKDESWMLANVYGDEVPELIGWDTNENSGNGRWGELVFYTYDGGSIKKLGSVGCEVNTRLGLMDGEPVAITISNGTGDWDVYKLNISDGSINIGKKLASGGYKSYDSWAKKAGGTSGKQILWHNKYTDMNIIEAIDDYE